MLLSTVCLQEQKAHETSIALQLLRDPESSHRLSKVQHLTVVILYSLSDMCRKMAETCLSCYCLNLINATHLTMINAALNIISSIIVVFVPGYSATISISSGAIIKCSKQHKQQGSAYPVQLLHLNIVPHISDRKLLISKAFALTH